MGPEKTKQQAYKDFDCWNCVFLDSDSGVCVAGNPESKMCIKTTREQYEY